MLRVLFMGTPAFAVPSLDAVVGAHEVVGVVTRPDKPRGRGQRVQPSEVKRRAVEHGLPVEQPRTLRDDAVQRCLAAYRPDVVVVVAYGLILPPAVLEMPPLGCINVHASLLPRHRGAAPVAWAILRGDSRTGVTTMLMDEGLDTGPILLQRAVPIGDRETTPELAERLSRLGAELLVETLDAAERGELEPRAQDDGAATLAPRFDKADGLVDWSRSPQRIDRQVRALQPWPGAHTMLRDRRLRLWEVAVVDGSGEPPPAPGTVVRADEGGLLVACGGGALLEILELQAAGGTRQPADAFLRGQPIDPGTRLGSDT